MMMMGDKKKAVTAILGPIEGEKEKDSAPADALELISEDLIAAVKAGDANAVASALRAAYAECGAPPEPTDD